MGHYITVDGDDIGNRIVRCYLDNNAQALARENSMINQATTLISTYLQSLDFEIIFCAADGVAAYSQTEHQDYQRIFREIQSSGNGEISFSAGVGGTLRESYIALLKSKSNGKSQLNTFSLEQL